MTQVYENYDNDEMISIKLDWGSHQILAKLAEKNERSKRAQLKVILREEAKRHSIDIKKIVEVKA
jgi:hypothetical protein